MDEGQVIDPNLPKRDYVFILQIVSGSLLIGIALIMKRLIKFDPIDSGYILNEQAIYLSSHYTDEVTDAMSLEIFIRQALSRNLPETFVSDNFKLLEESKKKKLILMEETKILNRW